MGEIKTYSGSCHCGKVRFDANMDLSEVVSCNCSVCSRKGWLLAFVPAEQFTLLSEKEALTDYQFGKKRIHHFFCATCGITCFSRGTGRDGREMVSVNARCLHDVDAAALAVKHFDGKSL